MLNDNSKTFERGRRKARGSVLFADNMTASYQMTEASSGNWWC